MTKLDGKAKTGVAGLDDILGGLTRGHVFLLEGEPGTGKTTIALQFLLEGAKQGETSLYITLSETENELRQGAASHGWTLGPDINIFELIPPESLLDPKQQQSLLYSSDLELGETTRQIFDAVERTRPSRVVLDSLSEIRLLAQSSLRYRRQILAIKHYFARYGATVLLLDDLTAEAADKTVHSLAHGVIRLEELAPAYGAERRRIRVHKYRGSAIAAVTTTSLSPPGASTCFLASSLPSTVRNLSASNFRPTSRNSMHCSAAESTLVPAPWCWDLQAPASHSSS